MPIPNYRDRVIYRNGPSLGDPAPTDVRVRTTKAGNTRTTKASNRRVVKTNA